MEIFLKRHVQAKNLHSGAEIERSLRKHAIPAFSTRPIVEIKREDVAELLDKVQDDGGPVVADRLLNYLSKLMNWYETQSGNYRSPLLRERGVLI